MRSFVYILAYLAVANAGGQRYIPSESSTTVHNTKNSHGKLTSQVAYSSTSKGSSGGQGGSMTIIGSYLPDSHGSEIVSGTSIVSQGHFGGSYSSTGGSSQGISLNKGHSAVPQGGGYSPKLDGYSYGVGSVAGLTPNMNKGYSYGSGRQSSVATAQGTSHRSFSAVRRPKRPAALGPSYGIPGHSAVLTKNQGSAHEHGYSSDIPKPSIVNDISYKGSSTGYGYGQQYGKASVIPKTLKFSQGYTEGQSSNHRRVGYSGGRNSNHAPGFGSNLSAGPSQKAVINQVSNISSDSGSGYEYGRNVGSVGVVSSSSSNVGGWEKSSW